MLLLLRFKAMGKQNQQCLLFGDAYHWQCQCGACCLQVFVSQSEVFCFFMKCLFSPVLRIFEKN